MSVESSPQICDFSEQETGLDKYSSLKSGAAVGKEITDEGIRKQQRQKRTRGKEVESLVP